MTFRAGIIGCGFISVKAPDNHAKAYIECEDTELVAGCDVDADRVRKCPAKNFYDDYMTMVKTQKLDIVSVCTPPETHCKIVCDIVPYVKAIYCEKPIAPTLEDADKMIEICQRYNVILQINHQRRFLHPKFKFARGIINTGTHVFDRLIELFGEVKKLTKDYIEFESGTIIELEYISSDEHIFDFDLARSKEPMILKGVQHLVECLKGEHKSHSNGWDGRKALELCLLYKELTGCE